jgi:hypothetical protein
MGYSKNGLVNTISFKVWDQVIRVTKDIEETAGRQRSTSLSLEVSEKLYKSVFKPIRLIEISCMSPLRSFFVHAP